MSIFLMGVWDPDTKRWCTVARCGNGHDDKTIEKLNKELKMTKISKVFSTFFGPASTFLERPVLRSLRAILCKNQAKWEMKNFDLPSNFACN